MIGQTCAAIAPRDPEWEGRARARLEQLTMPHWALGRVQDLAVELAGMTRSLAPPVARRTVVVMAADHGVAAEGVSQYPSAVTAQMVRNFATGGAAINALAGVAGADLVVVDMGVAADLRDLVAAGAVVDRRVRAGTDSIARGRAMSRAEAVRCLEAGIALARDLAPQVDVFATGDMGIGNTTPSAALAAAVTGAPPEEVTGRGTGVDDDRWRHKVAIVRRALEVHGRPADGVELLSCLGGFEIGGLAGLILGAAAWRRPVVVDGFIATAAALVAHRLAPRCADYIVAAHCSAESGHDRMWRHLGRAPLLDLGLRLGEGTGAALALPLLDAAVAVLTKVSTFADAGVSGPQ